MMIIRILKGSMSMIMVRKKEKRGIRMAEYLVKTLS